MTADTTEVANRLHSAAIHLLRQVRREDRHSGLSAARLSALSVLVFGGPLTVGRLAEIEQVRSPTMSRIIDQLAADGLVEREPGTRDSRQTFVRATDAGAQLLGEARQRRVAALARTLDALPADDVELLRRAADLLDKIVSGTHQGDR